MTTAREQLRGLLDARTEKTLRIVEQRQAIPQPTQYAGNKFVRSLGAAGGVPIRGLGRNALAENEPVAIAQGLLGGVGDNSTDEELRAILEAVLAQLRQVANRRGIQLFSGDPNDEENDGAGRAYQLFDQQLLYDTNGSRLYYHQPAIGVGVLDEWVQISTGGNTITFGDGPPSTGFTGTPTTGAQYWDNFVDRGWTYTAASTWQPNSKLSLTNTPSGSQVNSLVNGDLLSIGKYQWYWLDIDWVANHCCENGPDDPPTGQCNSQPIWLPDCPNAEGGQPYDPVWCCGSCPIVLD